jgi:hypothetical protein
MFEQFVQNLQKMRLPKVKKRCLRETYLSFQLLFITHKLQANKTKQLPHTYLYTLQL